MRGSGRTVTPDLGFSLAIEAADADAAPDTIGSTVGLAAVPLDEDVGTTAGAAVDACRGAATGSG